MKEAMEVIVETRKSTRLLTFVQSGIDSESHILLMHLILKMPPTAGDPSTVSRPEWPRGLNQLGNTCYLNSLLQVLIPHMAQFSTGAQYFPLVPLHDQGSPGHYSNRQTNDP